MPRLIDLTGQRFGRLVVIERAANSRTGLTRWRCRCDCGNETVNVGGSLKNGHTASCGCFRTEASRTRETTHGGVKTRAYKSWCGMKERCLTPSSGAYKNYGGRGITVCERWLAFENFLADMGECPEGCSLDRIDNEKGYCPDNCRWTTRKEQCRNRRTSRHLTIRGQTKTVAEWAEIAGKQQGCISARLKRGWSDHDAVFKDVRER